MTIIDKTTDGLRIRAEIGHKGQALEVTRWKSQGDGRWLRETAWWPIGLKLAIRGRMATLTARVDRALDKAKAKYPKDYQFALTSGPREFFAGVPYLTNGEVTIPRDPRTLKAVVTVAA